MKQLFRKNSKTLFRALLLASVLAGLLFSCGEGIRLFPFPPPEIATGSQTNLEIDDKIPYQFNIHRLEDNQRNFKTKSQRNSPHHYWIDAGVLTAAAFHLSNVRKKNNFPFASETLKMPLFSESGESRAPPLCI